MTLLPLSDDAFLFPGAVNSLVFANGSGGALLVDTGLDESHARKLLRAVQDAGLTPSAVLNTHAHADHHGGNAFLLKRFPELVISAPPLEAAIIRHPELEPLYLYGALPPKALQNKFLLAPSSPARPLEAGTQTLGGVTLDLLNVPGHAVQMFAVRRGGLLYAADALFGPDTLTKHPLTFCAESTQQKASAASLLGLEGVQLTVPGHGDATADLAGLVQLNLESLERTTQSVLHAVQAGAASTDTLLARVCADLGVTMTNPGAVLLNRSVVSAHLKELLEAGRVEMVTENNLLVFRAASA
ncbi:MBL fold metallo-hydrolase [Deinococcus sp. KNUC1210]|uniref:MBL fold metallo-hydrolase n=1 Tax=Deinococcus sp. KNUC1210 TaxID=2917691 RepID=UPI001EF13CCF|nr:MBL fold metallo-hydrolase [Deinococcus sp. KNUC1210]ULH16797.1 MBL fold metallo-hydrolase [Deinococcus sp. KNUC1210]